MWAVQLKDLDKALGLGGYVPTNDEVRSRSEDHTAEQLAQANAGGSAEAFINSALSSGTLGISDFIDRKIGGQESVEHTKATQDAHPTASLLGEIAGYAAPGGLAGKVGKAAKAAAGGRFIGSVLGGAAESAAITGSQSLREELRNPEPLDIDKIAGQLPHAVVDGALVGGAIGAIGGGISAAGRAAGRAWKNPALRHAEQEGLDAMSKAVNSPLGAFVPRPLRAAVRFANMVNKANANITDGVSVFASSDHPIAQRIATKLKTVIGAKNRVVETLVGAAQQDYHGTLSALTADMNMGDDGKMQLSPGAQEELDAQLSSVAQSDPVLAKGLSESAKRKLEFLANAAPKLPVSAAGLRGTKAMPPSAEMAKFLRQAKIVDDPLHILDVIAAGKLTDDEAKAMQDVYPDMYEEMQAKYLEKLSEKKKPNPYWKRLQMSIFFGQPMDPSLSPSVLKVLQEQHDFDRDQQEKGGMFGEGGPLKNTEQPTDSQRRMEP